MTKIFSVLICKKDTRRQYGFSLLEILVAIGLIAIISVVAVPSMMSAFRTSNEAFAGKTSNLLKEARDRALLRKKILRFNIDIAEQTYWLEETSASNLLPALTDDRFKTKSDREREKAEDPFKLVTDLTKKKVNIPRGIKVIAVKSNPNKPAIQEGVAEIYFYPDGTADGARIYLEDEEKVKVTILLHPVTGQSKTQPGSEGYEP